MDPYQRIMQEKRTVRKIRRRVCFCAFLIFLFMATFYGVYRYGGFEVTVKLNGDANVELKFGEAFEDPMAFSSFQGKYLVKNPLTVPVRVEGEVDPSRIGTYEIIYTARYGLWSAKTHRTVRIVDRIKPRILLTGGPVSTYLPGETYQEEGFLARDNYDGDLTDCVEVRKFHNRIIYTVTDSSGNKAEAVRKIICEDPVPPTISLAGDMEMVLHVGEKYKEPGYQAQDNLDGDLTSAVVITGKVDPYHAGTYTLQYTVKDSFSNRTTVSRTVKVVSTVQPEVVVPEGKVIYLTFDDGPGPYTRDLLAVLKKYDVKATFFVTKTKYAQLLKDIVQDGHSIGIHTVTHDYGEIYASEEAYIADMLKMQNIIWENTGVWTTLVRFPGGSSNTVSDFNPGIMTRLTKVLDEMGFQYFDWNVNSGDAGQTKETEQIVKYVIDGVKEYQVSIVLQHDIKKYSVEAVEYIIRWALENGYRFLPLEPNSPNAHHKVRN